MRQNLSFKDLIVCRRVNKQFQRISESILAQTTKLDLDNERYGNLSAEFLSALLNLCCNELKTFKIDDIAMVVYGNTFRLWRKMRLLEVLASFSCPKLTQLDIGKIPMHEETFENLFRNNENLELFTWDTPDGCPYLFPTDHIATALKLLYVKDSDDLFLLSLVNHCPNLTDLDLVHNVTDRTGNLLDRLFASTPRLKLFAIHDALDDENDEISDNDEATERDEIDCSAMTNLWKLSSIATLTLAVAVPDGSADRIVQKIVTSFPQLESLTFSASVSDQTLRALATLENLSELEIACGRNTDNALCTLARRGRLEVAGFPNATIKPSTFLCFLRSCKDLCRMEIYGISEVDEPEEASATLLGLCDVVPFRISCAVIMNSEYELMLWDSEEVQEVLDALEKSHGHVISFH